MASDAATPSRAKRVLRSRLTLSTLVWLAVAALAASTLASALGRWNWFCELFTHFRLYQGLALIVVVLLGVAAGRWAAAVLSAALLIPHLAALAYYYPVQEAPELPAELRVISFNVLTQNLGREEVCAYLEKSGADIIFLMETNRPWLEALRPLEKLYPHTRQAPRIDNFGMALYSRHPILTHEFLQFDDSEVPALSAVVAVGDREVEIHGAHPVPPMAGAWTNSRNRYLEEFAKRIASRQRPAIVMGDFNTTIWSQRLREFIQATDLRDSGAKRGYVPTWQPTLLPIAIPIDHVLHSRELTCTHREVGPRLGSDHRPVIAEFAFTPSP